MGQIRNALIRYRIIDKSLRSKYKPYPSKAELRKACEEALFSSYDGENVCDSTIEKDLFFLRMEQDAPIKYSKKHLGYYYSDPDFSLDEIPLTPEDLDAIRFAATTLSQFKEVDMFAQFGFAIDKVVERIAFSNDPFSKDISNFVQFESGTSIGGNEFLSPLMGAIRNKNYVHFEYESYISANKKPRKVIPLLLKEYRNRWYLVSYDSVKQDVITYALERMQQVEITLEVAVETIDFDVTKFFQNSIGITVTKSLPEKIIFKADNVSSKYIVSQPFHSSQKLIKEGKNRSTFEMNVIVSEELIRQILSFGGEIEVISPTTFRNQIIKRIQQMRSSYDI